MRDGYGESFSGPSTNSSRLVPAPVTKVFASGTRRSTCCGWPPAMRSKRRGTTRSSPSKAGSLWGPRRRRPHWRTTPQPEPIGAGLDWSSIGLITPGPPHRRWVCPASQPVHYTSNDVENLAFVRPQLPRVRNIPAPRPPEELVAHLSAPRRITVRTAGGAAARAWFRELGIEDLRSYEKRVPSVIFSASNEEVAVFLRHLWATDGNVTVPRTKTAPKVYYASSSRKLADDVALLLSRFSIDARIRKVTKAGYLPGFHVIVADGPSLRTFCRLIGVHGARGKLTSELSAFLDGRQVNTNTDTLPTQVWELVKADVFTLASLNASSRRQSRYSLLRVHALQGLPIPRAAPAVRGRCGLSVARGVATSDVYWDRIVGIEARTAACPGATVKGTHNFIADGDRSAITASSRTRT